METNTTPGPWIYYDAPNQHVGKFPCMMVLAPFKKATQAVAFCTGERMAENAKLISATPELLTLAARVLEIDKAIGIDVELVDLARKALMMAGVIE